MTINNIARNQMGTSMMRVASGQRINSAADDAAGLAIVEQMTSQLRGFDQGTRNSLDMQGLINTAEGGLDTISDSLQRVRELSVQAANDTNSDINRRIIQEEINQLADHIQTTVNNVQFNTRNLLDGGGENLHTASGPDGSGMTANINNMSGLAQAIANFNVTGSFNINDIDTAITQVNNERATIGAQYNRLNHTVNSNNVSAQNMADARSRINDADIAQEMMAVQQARVIDEVQLLMQRREQEREEDNVRIVAPGAPR